MGRQGIPGSQSDDTNVAVADEEEEADIRAKLKEAIQVKVDDTGVLRKTLTVTVPRENISQELDKEYKELIAEALVPGFRKGRAPRRLVEKRFGGEVGAQVQVRLVSNAYLAALDKAAIKVLGDPLVWARPKDKGEKDSDVKERLVDMPTALQAMKLPEEGDLQFRCEVEVKPEFEMPILEGVKIERPEVSISEADVDVQIDRIRARRGNWAPVSDGRVELDDLLICDITLKSGGKEFKKAENVQLSARPQRIEGIAIEEFGEKFKGAQPGETRSFEGPLPEDYSVEDLRGKQSAIEVTLSDIKRLELPEMDKAFLESQGFDTVAEYRADIKKQMEGQLEEEIRRAMRNQARRYLLDSTKLDLPEGLSSRQTDRAVIRKAIELRRQGVPESEIEKHADELRTSAKEQVATELKLHFIMEEIAAKLEIEVKEEEINAQIAAIAKAYNMRFDRVRDDLAKGGGIESLYLDLRDEKCVDRILEKAQIVKAEITKAPAAAEKQAAKPSKKKEADAAQAKEEKPKAARKPAKKSKE